MRGNSADFSATPTERKGDIQNYSSQQVEALRSLAAAIGGQLRSTDVTGTFQIRRVVERDQCDQRAAIPGRKPRFIACRWRNVFR